ncbi:MAG: hypothetical protein LUE14_04050 [Clostridiales bacterium]|nr:hypothetical protein [Clostridiales bacterium]
MTDIYELKEGSTDMRRVATYSIPPKVAMVAYVEQEIFHNRHSWEYPEILPGMRESDTVPDHWYYDAVNPHRVIAAYPR